ncbi:alpha-amylase inhibitor/seed storage/lipid transfer family protein [Acinetobacter baumannii]|uniref:alpha-amylase inhibitor/seed storage/lipid transfer family protein n=1 Tax=Acinetobacter baumannii TaxID=470 RepID=UPI0034DB543B
MIGDPVVNECCPVIQGLAGLEAALCLCTAIRAKVLSLNVYLPLALELIASCGLTPPEGFKCPEAS